MKISIFVHGVPDGQKVWSLDGGDAIVSNFYGQGQNENVKFLAEVRRNGNSLYAYYTYLKYNNVCAYNGRSGSYVGLTIRMDSLCTEVVNIYHVLDIVYGRNVVGKIVQEDGTKIKFITPELNDSNCKPIEQAIVNLLQNAISGRSFMMLTDQMAKGSGTTKLNILDCDKQGILNHLVQGTKVAISSQYDTTKDSATVVMLKQTISDLQAQNSKLKSDLSECSQRLSRLEEANSRMQRETTLWQEERKKNPQFEANRRMDEMCNKLNSLSDKIDENRPSDWERGVMTKIFPFLSTVIIIAAIGASWYLQKMQADAFMQESKRIEAKLEDLAKEDPAVSVEDTLKLDTSIVLDNVQEQEGNEAILNTNE